MFWHMQMHQGRTLRRLWSEREILEKYSFIGLAGLTHWSGGKRAHHYFLEMMAMNEIVAVRQGAEFIALAQVIGEADPLSELEKQDSLVGWMCYKRPIKILDWAHGQYKAADCYRPTLMPCNIQNPKSKTDHTIREWYERCKTL
ncbi:hypothetical protein [Helicobacter bizzozeronii]|uniref:hypothetical protein n=1 Tax=Helicobacter bizzozeronii TaxID=56877 RepID=UPI001F42ACC1|nr:hypothetical protein [Helicobacter bizzozeronii]